MISKRFSGAAWLLPLLLAAALCGGCTDNKPVTATAATVDVEKLLDESGAGREHLDAEPEPGKPIPKGGRNEPDSRN